MTVMTGFRVRLQGVAALAPVAMLAFALAAGSAAWAQQPATEVREGADGRVLVVLPDGSEVELEPGMVDDLGAALETLPEDPDGLTPVTDDTGDPDLFDYGTSQLGQEFSLDQELTYNAAAAAIGEGPVEGGPGEIEVQENDDGGGPPLSGLNELISDSIEGVDVPEPASRIRRPSIPNAN